ncbi:MAG: hypothetical protein VW262_06050 [Flavobacteriaceae bacterium]|jgi:hypothetical protein
MTFNRNTIPIIPEIMGKRFREEEKLHLADCKDCQDKRDEIYANFTIKGKIYTDEARLCASETQKVVKHFKMIGKKCVWYEMLKSPLD